MKPIAIAGAGFTGAIIANELAKAGYQVEVFEPRSHIAGNCYSARDSATGIMVHHYGPHIFHTDDDATWHYVNTLTAFKPFVNRVKANSGGKIYSLPINLHTINQFFGCAMSPTEAKTFIAQQVDRTDSVPANFEQQGLQTVGPALYQAFYAGYTRKQWGLPPAALPASIFRLLPLRFDYNDNYFSHRYQGIPVEGYTPMVERLLAHPNIRLHLTQRLTRAQQVDFQHIFWSGPLDAFFDYRLGRLPYRTLDFKTIRSTGDYQGGAVVNYCDADIPYTRISEFKHFTPWESHHQTLCYVEFSRQATEADEPYYPIRLANEKQLLADYISLAQQETSVTFAGRLGTYRYLDMDATIREARQTAAAFLSAKASQQSPPIFVMPPL